MTMKQLCNLDAERALLGSVLIDQSILDKVGIEASAFFLERHQIIWRTFHALKQAGGVVDILTLTDKLAASGKLEEIGGGAYVMQLISDTPTSIYSESYASIITEKYERRQMLLIAEQLAKAAYDEEHDITSARTAVIDQIIKSQRTKSGARHIKEFLSSTWEDLAYRRDNPKDIYGITTGFPDIDRYTGGLQTGEVLMLSGEPGIGKSILGMQFAFNSAAAGHASAIYEMEMGDQAFIRRELSGKSGIITRKMKSGDVSDGEWTTLVEAIGAMEQLPVYLDFGTHWNTTSMRADLTRLKISADVKLVIVDYLDYLTDTAANENDRSAHISRSLHNIAKDLDVAIVTINSMNKTGMDAQRPTQSNLSGSGKVAYDADVIAFLTSHIPENGGQPEKNLRTLTYAKNREGAKTFIHLVKDDKFPAFKSYKPTERK